MKSEKMVDMAVAVLRVIDVAGPFHDLTETDNPIRRQMALHVEPFLALLLIKSKKFRRRCRIKQYFPRHGMGECGSLVYGPMFPGMSKGWRCRSSGGGRGRFQR